MKLKKENKKEKANQSILQPVLEYFSRMTVEEYEELYNESEQEWASMECNDEKEKAD